MALPLLLMVLFLHSLAEASLHVSYYARTCPNATSIVKNVVYKAVKHDPRMAASLLRLHFHDCFVHGCDASVLLDKIDGEKMAPGNKNSLRGYDVIDHVKLALEKECPGVVSCADILAIAARDSVVKVGGPTWKVRMGRRDSTIPGIKTLDLPAPFESVKQIIQKFHKKKLSIRDMVALSGAHTIGMAHCSNFKLRLYGSNTTAPDTNINPHYLASLKSTCPPDDTLFCLDVSTPNAFDNLYYTNLLNKKSLLHSDQELYDNHTTKRFVKHYASSQAHFFKDFAKAMVKMGNISPLVGSNGQIRNNCHFVNTK